MCHGSTKRVNLFWTLQGTFRIQTVRRLRVKELGADTPCLSGSSSIASLSLSLSLPVCSSFFFLSRSNFWDCSIFYLKKKKKKQNLGLCFFFFFEFTWVSCATFISVLTLDIDLTVVECLRSKLANIKVDGVFLATIIKFRGCVNIFPYLC